MTLFFQGLLWVLSKTKCAFQTGIFFCSSLPFHFSFPITFPVFQQTAAAVSPLAPCLSSGWARRGSCHALLCPSVPLKLLPGGLCAVILPRPFQHGVQCTRKWSRRFLVLSLSTVNILPEALRGQDPLRGLPVHSALWHSLCGDSSSLP